MALPAEFIPSSTAQVVFMGEWTVTVSPHQTVAVINLTILESNVPQLESFRIKVKTYDGWENQIPVPPETVVKLTEEYRRKRGQIGN